MASAVERRPGMTWSLILVSHRGLILYLIGLFGWVVAVPLFGDTMTIWAAGHGSSIATLSDFFLVAHAISLVVSGIHIDWRPQRAAAILRLVPLGNACLLLMVLWLPMSTWNILFALMGMVTAFGMTTWGRWYATTVRSEWLGQTFALAAAGVAAFHGAFGVLAGHHVSTEFLLYTSLLPLALAIFAVWSVPADILPTASDHPRQTKPLSSRLLTGASFALFVCFFSVVAGLSDRFFVAAPITPFIHDFMRMAPYIIGVLISGVVADRNGLLWMMVSGAGLLAVSFLIGSWSYQPQLALLGLFCNGMAFGMLEPAPWLLLASSCTEGTAGRWFGWGLNLNVIPIFIGSVIAVPLGHISAERLALLASFFILMAILFLFGTRDPLGSLRSATGSSTPDEISNASIGERFDVIFRDQLSEREVQVGKLAVMGKSNRDIAELLYISENTVKFHLKNVFRKTNCANRNDLYREIVGRPHS